MVILLGPAMGELRDAMALKAPGGGAAPPAGSKQVTPPPHSPPPLAPSPLGVGSRTSTSTREVRSAPAPIALTPHPRPHPSPLTLAFHPLPHPHPLACAQEGAQGGAQGEGAQQEGAKLEEAERAWRERCAATREPGAAAAAEGSETFEVVVPTGMPHRARTPD